MSTPLHISPGATLIGMRFTPFERPEYFSGIVPALRLLIRRIDADATLPDHHPLVVMLCSSTSWQTSLPKIIAWDNVPSEGHATETDILVRIIDVLRESLVELDTLPKTNGEQHLEVLRHHTRLQQDLP